MTIDVARLRELHQPMYGHTGDPCSWCREWTPCPVAELLDAYEERERLRGALQGIVTAIDSHHPKYKHGPFALTHAEMDAARAALEGRE